MTVPSYSAEPVGFSNSGQRERWLAASFAHTAHPADRWRDVRRAQTIERPRRWLFEVTWLISKGAHRGGGQLDADEEVRIGGRGVQSLDRQDVCAHGQGVHQTGKVELLKLQRR